LIRHNPAATNEWRDWRSLGEYRNQLYLKTGDYRKAVQRLHDAAKRDAKNMQILRELGRAYQLSGEGRKAQATLRKASQLALTSSDEAMR
jgi:Tfp pilus assembly protein PilF